MLQVGGAVALNMHDNRFINQIVGLVRYVFINPTTAGQWTHILNNTFEQFAGTGATAQIGLQLSTGTTVGECEASGNQFGIATASGTQNFSNSAIDVQSGWSG